MQMHYSPKICLNNRILIVEPFNPISIQITTISNYILTDLIFNLLKFTRDALTKVKDRLQKTWDGIKDGKELDKINTKLVLGGIIAPLIITGYNNIKDITANMMLSLAVFIASDLVTNYALVNPANKMSERLYLFLMDL